MYARSWALDVDTTWPAILQNILPQPHWIAALEAHFGPVTLDVLCWEQRKVFPDERILMTTDTVWTRMVVFKVASKSLACGRVLIPPKTYAVYQQALTELKTMPLGDALLYAVPNTSRSPFTYAALTKKHPWWQSLAVYDIVPPEPFVVRRSVFQLANQYPLLVCEGWLR